MTLRSISTPDLLYLAGLPRLRSVDIKLGGTRDLSALASLSTLKYLELWQIRGLQDVSVPSGLTTLQNLFMQTLSRITALPGLQECRSLRRIVLDNLSSLREISTLEHAPALEEFGLIQGESLEPGDVEAVLRNPHLRRIAAFFGSNRQNRAFNSLRERHGKEPFEWTTPFAYS